MKNEAIILAGGKGTRLRSVVSDLPKPMAPVAGIPFLEHQLNYLHTQNIDSVILSVGYKAEAIIGYFGETYKGITLKYAYEKQPLGTGGAILNALRLTTSPDVYILNGDTYFPISLSKLNYLHKFTKASITMALRILESDGRYGGTSIDGNGRITGFTSKDQTGVQIINGGIYRMNVSLYKEISPNQDYFSFEEDILKKFYGSERIYGVSYYDYFVDIGVPFDYARANIELACKNKQQPKCLFLDRDGVINRKIEGGYVTNWTNFDFLDGVLSSLQILTNYFDRIVIITNQRGVARGLMTDTDLDHIHGHMIKKIELLGGNIDGIYVCPHHNDNKCDCRKPKMGLIEQAKQDFPIIKEAECYLVGDSESDMLLGRRMGFRTILIGSENELEYSTLNLADEVYMSLYNWTKTLNFYC